MSSEQRSVVTSSQNVKEEFTHNIQLQLFDGYTLPVDNTQFWVTLKIIKEGKKVTIQLPTINFQTGPLASNDVYGPYPGGMLRTSDGFLPEELRPSDPVYRSYLGASNNGMSLPFSFATPPQDLPVPIAGYIISVTFFGGLIIQGAGTFENLVPPGAQVLMPTDITYIVEKTEKLCKNFPISTGATNITQFTGGVDGAIGTALRDSHVNDAFDGVVGWAWADNSNIADKTNNTTNIMVVIGKIKDGKLKVGSPVQLTNNPVGTFIFSTAVAINRTNKKNIVVSWATGNDPTTPYRAVSFDGGKTWPINGMTNIQPVNGAGDNRGVAADKFGNIWYSSTINGIVADQPTFWISSDGGVTFSTAYTAEPFLVNPTDFGWDFPQFCFGGDGQGNYGLWFTADYIIGSAFDVIPVVGFVPITGLGTYGAGTTQFLYSFINTQFISSVAASEDGRAWFRAWSNIASTIAPMVVRFKSPGLIDQNYAGPWNMSIATEETSFATSTPTISYPVAGYANTVTTIVYDEKRQALYTLFAQQAPDFAQNMRIFLLISRDNGQTWSQPFYVSNTDFANRGFPSMALDPVTGDLVFGWYDGRNDKTYQSVQYFAAILSAKRLTKMVEKIPLSDPLFTLPPATPSLQLTTEPQKKVQKNTRSLKRRINRRELHNPSNP